MKKILLFFLLLLSFVSCSRKSVSIEREVHDTLRIEKSDTIYVERNMLVRDTIFRIDSILISEVSKITLDASGNVVKTEIERNKEKIVNKGSSHVTNATSTRHDTSKVKEDKSHIDKGKETVTKRIPLLQRLKDNVYWLAASLFVIVAGYYFFIYSKRGKKG